MSNCEKKEYISVKYLENLLKNKFIDSDIEIEDTAGDGSHFYISVKSSDFINLSRIQQHRMVYDSMGDLVNVIHAMKIKTSVK